MRPLRRPASFRVAAALLVAIFFAGCGGSARSEEELSKKRRITTLSFTEAEATKARCESVQEHPEENRKHTPIGTDHDYDQNPPTSGVHYPEWGEWGVYDEGHPLEDEWLVHNLEHGGVAITYKGISSRDVQELRRHLDSAPYHLLLTPRDDNPREGVYYLAWNHSLYCEKPSAAALQHMIDSYRDKGAEEPPDDQGHYRG